MTTRSDVLVMGGEGLLDLGGGEFHHRAVALGDRE